MEEGVRRFFGLALLLVFCSLLFVSLDLTTHSPSLTGYSIFDGLKEFFGFTDPDSGFELLGFGGGETEAGKGREAGSGEDFRGDSATGNSGGGSRGNVEGGNSGGDPLGSSLSFNISDSMAPVGASSPGQTSVALIGGKYLFTYSEGSNTVTQYEIDTLDIDVRNGLIQVYEAVSRSYPLFNGGLTYRNSLGLEISPQEFLALNPQVTFSHSITPENIVRLEYDERVLDNGNFYTTTKVYDFELIGKTLVLHSYTRSPPLTHTNNYAGMDFGTSSNTQNAKHKIIPYMEHAPTLIFDNGAGPYYASIYFDWSKSNSGWFPSRNLGPTTQGSYRYSYSPEYDLGEANTFSNHEETTYITVSDSIEDAWMEINRPASNHLANLKNMMLLDIGALYSTRFLSEFTAFERAEYLVGLAHRYGMKDLLVELWNWMPNGDWPCYATRPGYNTANEGNGGLTGMKKLVTKITGYGYVAAVYQEYIGMYDTTINNVPHPGWNESKLAKDKNGNYKNYGWAAPGCPQHRDPLGKLVDQPMTIKPDEWKSYYEFDSQKIKKDFGVGASFIDVHSKIPPYLLIDSASDNDQSRTMRQIVEYTKEFFDFQHTTFNGPLITEGGAGDISSSDAVYAGYTDGVYGEIQGEEHAEVIPDYDLKYVKNKMIRYSMGFHERWDTTNFDLFTFDWDKYRATQIAYGRAGYMGDWMLLENPTWNIWTPTATEKQQQQKIYDEVIRYWVKEYYLFDGLQEQYLNANVFSIEYLNQSGSLVDLSQAIEQGVDFNNSQLKIMYDNGLVIFVNRHQSKRWDVATPLGTHYLPPNGWIAYNMAPATTLLAYSSLVNNRNVPDPNGQRVDFSLAKDYVMADGRGNAVNFGNYFGQEGLTDRLLVMKQGGWMLTERKGKTGFDLRGDSSGDPAIFDIVPRVVQNDKDTDVSIIGKNLNSFYGMILDQNPLLYNVGNTKNPYLDYINSTLVTWTVPKGTPQGNYNITLVTSQGNLVSNTEGMTIGASTSTATIIQATPIPAASAQDGIITLWGEGFAPDMKVLVNGIEFTGNKIYHDTRKYEVNVTPAGAPFVQTIQFEMADNTKSNLFFINETMRRHPEFVTISEVVFDDSTQGIVLEGHNFNPRTSKLYVNDLLVDPSLYAVETKTDGSFRMLVNVAPLPHGTYAIRFENPTREPARQHARGAPYSPFRYNSLHFEKKRTLNSDIVLENSQIQMVFDGDLGRLQSITEKGGRTYTLANIFPWRVQLRNLDPQGSLRNEHNRVQSVDYFNPVEGTCEFSHALTQTAQGKKLVLSWKNCMIDANNSFDFEKRYVLKDSDAHFEMNYSITNPNVRNYGVHSVRNYMTFVDDPAIEEFGLVSNRITEAYREPGYTIETIGGRETCSYNPGAVEERCSGISYEAMPEFWMNNDGDGFKLYNFMDIWGTFWDINGNYIYYMPIDDHQYTKDFSYQGQFGSFKNGLISYHPNSYFAADFAYDLPYSIRIGVGKGTEFIGRETWINFADIYRENLKDFGRLKTPFVKRDIPNVLKNLDLHLLGVQKFDFFTENDTAIKNPPIDKIVAAYNASKEYLDVENMYVFMWGGDQNDSIGLRFEPTAETGEFFEKLNDAGINTCYYTESGALTVALQDPLFDTIKNDVMAIDPAGTPFIFWTGRFNYTAMHPLSTDLNRPSYVKYLVDKFRAMHESPTPGKKRARCFYMDGVVVHGYPDGVWSQKFGSKGFDLGAANYSNYIRAVSTGIRTVDSEAFVMHEAFIDSSTREGVIAMQGAPTYGAYRELWAGASPHPVEQDIFFGQRVFAGYTDFLVSNPMSSPNNPPPSFHIEPQWYDSFYNAPFNIPRTYKKSLEQTFLLPHAVGFLQAGGVPFTIEPGINNASNYTPMYLTRTHNTNPALSAEWKDVLSTTADFLKNLVAARKLARPHFHGLWHPPMPSDSPLEDYYYVYSTGLLSSSRPQDAIYKVQYPRVINIVRQPWDAAKDTWSEDFGLLFINTHSTGNSESVTFTFDYSRYGIAPGEEYGLFEKTKTGNRYLKKVTGDFTHTLTIPKHTFTLLELRSFRGMADSDSDSIPDLFDRCPKTPARFVSQINRFGCPKPLVNKFSSQLSTNFSQVDNLSAIDGLELGIRNRGANVGKILFREIVSMLRTNTTTQGKEPLDLERFISIEKNTVYVDSNKLPELDVNADITFFNTGISNPLIHLNGEYNKSATIRRYNTATKDVVARVPGFSNYTVVEGTCGDDICGFTETKTSCSKDCGSPTGGPGGNGGGGGGGGSGKKTVSRILLDDFSWHWLRATTNHRILLKLNGSEYTVEPRKISDNSVTLTFVNVSDVIEASNDRRYYVDIDGKAEEDITFTVEIISGREFLFNVTAIRDPSVIDRGGNRTGDPGNETRKRIGGPDKDEDEEPSAWILLLLAIPIVSAIIFGIIYGIIIKRRSRQRNTLERLD